MVDPLADMMKRSEWADNDGRALQAELAAFVESQPYMVRLDTDGNVGTATLCKMIDPTDEAKVLDRCANLIGSFLDHTRAALNYAVYQLALIDLTANPALDAEKVKREVEFPIFPDATLYGKGNRVKKLSKKHRDAIEAVQPYDGKLPGLWLLNELARSYRHRIVHPAVLSTFAESHGVNVTNGSLESMDVLYAGPVQYDTPVLRYTVIPSGKGQVHAHANVAISVSIDHVLCGGRQSITVLNEIGRDASTATRALSELIPVYRG